MDLEKITSQLINRNRNILGSENFSKFSILLPLLEKDNELHILFEVRAHHLRRQPGEICFPGGKIDKSDKNEQFTAIRETTEELGISSDLITNVFPLDYMVSPFGSIIYPYVGVISEPDKIKANQSEVAEIFTVPITYFQKAKPDCYKMNFKINPEPNFPYELIEGGQNYDWQTRHLDEYFYFYDDYVIWGLTARVLYHFLEVVGRSER